MQYFLLASISKGGRQQQLAIIQSFLLD